MVVTPLGDRGAVDERVSDQPEHPNSLPNPRAKWTTHTEPSLTTGAKIVPNVPNVPFRCQYSFMCKDPKDTKLTSQNTIEPNFKKSQLAALSLSLPHIIFLP